MDPGIVPNAARKVTVVTLADGPHTLWVAPTKSGGFCVTWTGLWGGCRSRQAPAALPAPGSWDLRSWDLGMTVQQEHGATTRLGGSLLAPDAVRLVVDYEDGASDEIPFTWVSPPIDAAFYVYEVPTEHRAFGHRAAVLRAVDANGEDVARASIPTPAPGRTRCPPAAARWHVHLPPAQGARRQSPPRDRAHDRERHPRGGLDTPDDRRRHLLRLQPRKRLPAARIRADRADGGVARKRQQPDAPPRRRSHPRSPRSSSATRTEASERIRPTDGFVLTEVRPAHYPRGHRLALVDRLRPGRARAPATDVRHNAARHVPVREARRHRQGRHVLPIVERAPVGGARSAHQVLATSMPDAQRAAMMTDESAPSERAAAVVAAGRGNCNCAP